MERNYLQTVENQRKMEMEMAKPQLTNQGYPPPDAVQQMPTANNLMAAQNLDIANQNYFQTCNEGIAKGFGAMFFNIQDPNSTKTNMPVRQKPSLHMPVVIFNLIFFAGLIISIIGVNTFLSVGATIAIIVCSYLLYLIITCCCSEIREYISNTKRLEEYEETYRKMVDGKGYFNFHIQCYHYVTTHNRHGTHRRKVVTHTANEVFRPRESLDESGQITSIYEDVNRTFIHYDKKYYFSDNESERRFIDAFNSFVSRNRRDTHQSYNHQFQIDNFEEYASFTATGEGDMTNTFFILFTLLGLAFPYSCIFERSVSRYEVGLLKKLTA